MLRSERRWSPEVHALIRPAAAFARLIQSDGARASLLRRPLLFVFVLGCGVSAMASGRFSVRLITDGAVSFGFIPAIEIAALAAVSWTGRRRRIRFARTVDLFFVGNAPWLLWLVLLSATACLMPPEQLGSWIRPALAASLIPLGWSAYIDFHFFRAVMQRPSRGAVRDLLLHRGIGWTAAMVYFVGVQKLTQRLGELIAWAGA